VADTPKSRPRLQARLSQWREQRKRAAEKRRASAEQRINQERYRYKGPGAPGA
jgi:hypothetical protein